MHFLCLSLGSVDSGFFLGLKESLSSVHEVGVDLKLKDVLRPPKRRQLF